VTEWTGVDGKRVIITGATGGIGLAAAEALAGRGAQLALVARDEDRARRAKAQIETASGTQDSVDVLSADLSSQRSVRDLAAEILERYPRIDALVNNAGAMYSTRRVTEDGVELTWALNHLAPFLLTTLLLDRLKQSAPARVITTASDAHRGASLPLDDLNAEKAYSAKGFRRYGQSKLANILFTLELGSRLESSGVTASCFHPGLVATGFNHNNGGVMGLAMTILKPFSRSPEKGAETLVWLCDSDQVPATNGGYFVDKKLATPSAAAQDAEAAHKLWAVSQDQVRPGEVAET
jgi:NAD(P)-dependent dehydrogenase (short-subunit alcohol dehydrogenase family)